MTSNNGANGAGSASTNGAGAVHDEVPSLPHDGGHGPTNGDGAQPAVQRVVWPVPAARSAPPTAADESVEVGALVRAVARGWRVVLAGGVIGAFLGLLVLLVVPPWYRGTASVLVRNANDPAGSLLSRIGIGGDLAGAAAGGALGGVLKSPLETEVQLLQSRQLVGQIVDSLALQARVVSPRGVPAARLLAPGQVGGSFRSREVAFTRQSDGRYLAVSGDSSTSLVPGRSARVAGVGLVQLAAGPLPPAFRVRFEDRADAITRAVDQFAVEKKLGEVIDLRYNGPDSLTAAAVPNVAIAEYLALRRTVDRGVNQRRYEFMAAQADTASRQLAAAEDALRRGQEATGVVDPELVGRSELEAIQQVRAQFVPLESERRAAHALVDSVERGAVGPRQLAAFPSFLRAPAINSILSQVTTLETERTRLLGTRTERDPDVVVLTQSIADLERGLLPLARTYAGSLDRQTQELTAEQERVQTRLGALPAGAEATLRLQRDVKRLSTVVLGLQAQMIDVRLAALSEGGQVRQVDVAVPPKRPVFPRAVWTLPGGVLLGLFTAVAWVLGRGALSSRVHSTTDAERVSGLPGLAFRPGAPLLLPAADAGAVLVLGADASSATGRVADALAMQARARGRSAVVLDTAERGTPSAADTTALRDAIERAMLDHHSVFIAAASLDDPTTAGMLDPRRPVAVVATPGVTSRDALASATDVLDRLGVPVLGVVLATGARR